jgi:hypothetical protein
MRTSIVFLNRNLTFRAFMSSFRSDPELIVVILLLVTWTWVPGLLTFETKVLFTFFTQSFRLWCFAFDRVFTGRSRTELQIFILQYLEVLCIFEILLPYLFRAVLLYSFLIKGRFTILLGAPQLKDLGLLSYQVSYKLFKTIGTKFMLAFFKSNHFFIWLIWKVADRTAIFLFLFNN